MRGSSSITIQSLRVAVTDGWTDCVLCRGRSSRATLLRPRMVRIRRPRDVWGRSALQTIDELQWKALLRNWQPRKPIIAAVEGAQRSRVAPKSCKARTFAWRVAGAKFGVAEAKWSLYPLGGSVIRLRRQIPYTLAAEMLLTGQSDHGRGGLTLWVDRAGGRRRSVRSTRHSKSPPPWQTTAHSPCKRSSRRLRESESVCRSMTGAR